VLQPIFGLAGKQLHKLRMVFQHGFELPRFLSQLIALATFEAVSRNNGLPFNRFRTC
jgi:hypothetical protein